MGAYGLLGAASLASRPAVAADVAPARREYNAPDPQRGGLDYARAAANLVFTNWVFWQVAWARDRDWAPVTRTTLRANLKAGFTFDQDVLQTNFFGHPYHGGLQFNAARSAGLSFWESALYTFGGSLAWELFAEREKPALNDLAVTTLGGILLGEMTFRLSSELLDEGSDESRLLRELAAACVNPVRGFDRAVTGRAWSKGAPAIRHPLRLELDVGADRVSLNEEQGTPSPSRPALLLATRVRYGDLLPVPERTSFEPLEYFEIYAAANLLNSQLSGAHVYSSGLLYGISTQLSSWPRPFADNDVLGVALNYEYVGTDFTTYSGLGFGPVNHLVLRRGGHLSVRLSVGADFVPILGATSTEAGHSARDYNFATGVSPWSGVAVGLGPFGEIGLQMRHYIAEVVDGERGEEFIGSTRLWYELKAIGDFGIGLAPTWVYRRGHYDASQSYWAEQLSAQLYFTVGN